MGDPTLKTELAALKAGLGYVTYIAVITKERDKDGNNLVKHFYQRHNVNWEDTGRAVKTFATHVKEDYTAWMDEQSEG